MKLLEALADRERDRRDNPLKYAKYNKPQKKFFDCVTDDGRIPRRLLDVGSNKLGKTNKGAMRGVSLAIGEHPFLPDDHPLRHTRHQVPVPNAGLVMGEKLTQVVDRKLVPTYRKWIPKACQPQTKKNPQGIITKIMIHRDLQGNSLKTSEFPNGSVIYFGSYDMDVESQEGSDYNWIHWDEPPPYKHYVAGERGLVGDNGVSWITFTSLKEPWIKDLADTSIDYGGNDKSTRIIEGGAIWEGLIENGGFLTREAIEEFIKIVPKEEYGARILGEWTKSGARIFSSFCDDYPWVISPFDIPRDWTMYEFLDPHDVKDTNWLFGATSSDEIDILGERANRCFLVDYLRLEPVLTITEMVEIVKKKRIELHYDFPQSVIIDAKYGRRRTAVLDTSERATWEEKLEDVDVGYIELADQKPGDIDLGHKIVKEYLKPQFCRMEETAVPGLVIFDTCRGKDGPIEAMLKYRKKKNSDEPEDDEYKGLIDPLRYWLMKIPTYVDRSRLKRKRQTGNEKVKSKYAGR